MDNKQQKVSKFLSYVLRHKPEAIGLVLDSEGWAEINQLIKCAAKHRENLTIKLIHDVVANNDKKRFTLSENGSKIRAAQGHSTTQVNLSYQAKAPPALLYHGTATRFIDSIKTQGLIAGSRHYVHLSTDEKTAITVGKRHGKVVVLTVKAQLMQQQGFKFYQADNDVWLTQSVPVEFLGGL